ncbi:hypothetical protein SAY87_031633 [Trapa incisa]|uniref:Uncharacterized protein n=1 Tax=Trapa incisa TaxID=236973 RepID=A0AAN7KPT2_9MYRT|nr:hypothetical protein SAY87_031633 [Trapa incisa]
MTEMEVEVIPEDLGAPSAGPGSALCLFYGQSFTFTTKGSNAADEGLCLGSTAGFTLLQERIKDDLYTDCKNVSLLCPGQGDLLGLSRLRLARRLSPLQVSLEWGLCGVRAELFEPFPAEDGAARMDDGFSYLTGY